VEARARPPAAALLAEQSAGCGKSGRPSKLDLSGAAKYDGQDVREGKNTVKIHANRPVPGKRGPVCEQAVEQYIPKQYNDESTLAVEVAPGKTRHDFGLKK
jgi:hypothetical protein